MRLLSHDSDGACANGRRHGSMSSLWSDGDFSDACARSSACAAAMGSTTDGGSSPGISAPGLASCTSSPHDGRDARHGYWHEHACTGFQYRTAAKARPRPAAAQRLAQCSCRSASPLAGCSWSHAFFRLAGCTRWNVRRRSAQSIAPYSRITHSAQHAAHGWCWRHAWHVWNARSSFRIVIAGQRSVPCTGIATDAAAARHGCCSTQPGWRFVFHRSRGSPSRRPQHCQPAHTARDEFYQARLCRRLPARISGSRRLLSQRPPHRHLPRPCRT